MERTQTPPPPSPASRVGNLRELLTTEESVGRIDAVWCWTFILVFFAIHIGRMNVDWNLVGMVSPLVAVLGDVGTGCWWPSASFFRSNWPGANEPSVGTRRVAATPFPGRRGKRARAVRATVRRLARAAPAFSLRAARMRYSPRAALRRGLQVGLPVTAILIAVNPIWGFSWFFNSESWATEIWDRWAAARTDTWREQMIRAVEDRYGTGSTCFRSHPREPRTMQISASWCWGTQAKAARRSTACATSFSSLASVRTCDS